MIHDRLAALRQILGGGNYLEAETLKVPSDMWEQKDTRKPVAGNG